MLVVSSREFQNKQQMYFDLIDKKERVIVQRGKNKAYSIMPISEDDIYFSDPQIRERLERSIAQANAGETFSLKKEDIKSFLGLE